MKKLILLFSMAYVLVFFGRAAISAPLIYIDLDGNSLTAETNWSVNLGDTFSADIYALDFSDAMGSALAVPSSVFRQEKKEVLYN